MYQLFLHILGGLVPGPPRISKSSDAQVPYYKMIIKHEPLFFISSLPRVHALFLSLSLSLFLPLSLSLSPACWGALLFASLA